jgi:hypothetical protein
MAKMLDRVVWDHLGFHFRDRAVVRRMANELRVGATVQVPWGLKGDVEGKIVEVWGDPPAHVRVQLLLEGDEEPVVLLLAPSMLTAA